MKVLCLLGPTATGKSETALDVAERFGGEIINADSMQVYRYLAIGTQVPPEEYQKRVPHHLYQYLNPDEEPDAMRWAQEASKIAKEVYQKGKVPILVGGTFFWLRALLEGLDEIPCVPKEVRLALQKELKEKGLDALFKRLFEVDKETAQRLHPTDTQRILRALEVYEATGTPISSYQKGNKKPVLEANFLKICLILDRQKLYERINKRAKEMVLSGIVEEVQRCLDMGYSRDIRPLRSSSYVPVLRYLDEKISLDEMCHEIAKAHRHYAKRQITWLRKEKDLIFVQAYDKGQLFSEVERFLSSAQHTTTRL
jgi:tRNA dimethylallyltransferase